MPKRKEELDQQTSYLTFLPHMDEGFHTGYQTNPGVVNDRSQRPREWLESLSRNMRTQGADVGYSIPDVLAGEQQLRRLARQDAQTALRHQPMVDFRAVLAVLLLWDTWEADATWPKLDLVCLNHQETSFASSISSALTPDRAQQGLWAFVLRSAREADGLVKPLALLSQAMGLVPAANPGDLSQLLPSNVRWYDRDSRCFVDPCMHLSAADAFRLIVRLRTLQVLQEEPRWQSPLLQADGALISVIDRFIFDILEAQLLWARRLNTGDTVSLSALRTRLLAVHTLPAEKHILRPEDYPAKFNPLIRQLSTGGLPASFEDSLTLHLWKGEPFAVQSAETLLSPARTPEEETLLHSLENELSLLQKHDAAWRKEASDALRRMHAECETAVGLMPGLSSQLIRWAEELDAIPVPAVCELTVDGELSQCSAAMQALVCRALGVSSLESVFSDVLLFLSGSSPYDDEALAARCTIDGLGTAVPPLSPSLCQLLMHTEGLCLAPESLRLERRDQLVTVQFTLLRLAPGSAITFRRSYRLSQQMETGAACVLPLDEQPGITVWPNVRLTPGLWRKYYTFVETPKTITAWVPHGTAWESSPVRTLGGACWQTMCSPDFPAFVLLKRAHLSLGALINDLPQKLVRHEAPAAIAIDFGSISTTVMMRQGDEIQPAVLPECMHRTLLSPGDPTQLLANVFLPKDVLLPNAPIEATFYSLMDMFSDNPENWNGVLEDGHIYFRTSQEALARKSASALYYDLKWSEETFAQRVLRLFLKQVMLQGALSARLWGSSSMSFRVSMPNALPLHRQEAYLDLMQGLAREVAQETGMALTPGVPAVLHASENQADGLYFLSRSEVNARSGYLNLDIGGSTADLSLWLGGAGSASIECSLLRGCRQMLYHSLLDRHCDAFEADFSSMDETLARAIQEIVFVYRREGSTTRGQRKCALLLDDLFAAQAPALREAMAQTRSLGRISYLESLLLFECGYLFYLAGEMLQRAWQEESLRSQLPARMELCIAGNGGQLLKFFTDDQQASLCSLALQRLSVDHPLQALLPVQSRHPKQEVARGLLVDDTYLQKGVAAQRCFNGTHKDSDPQNPLSGYLELFGAMFPQAARKLMPLAYEESGLALSPAALMELDTIFANELPRLPGDDLALYTRCMESLKRLWKI